MALRDGDVSGWLSVLCCAETREVSVPSDRGRDSKKEDLVGRAARWFILANVHDLACPNLESTN
jgi:hypothetical protein